MFKKRIVTNLFEYIEVVKEIKENNELVWFRGQSDASRSLVPKAMRTAKEVIDLRGFRMNPRDVQYNTRGSKVLYLDFVGMLTEFKSEAKKYIKELPENDLVWLLIAQHYGLPTTLLDWSTDPLVALFFAIPGNLNKSKVLPIDEAIEDFERNSFSNLGAAVYAINPCTFNSNSGDIEMSHPRPLNVIEQYDILSGYLYPSEKKHFITPLCIYGTKNDKRMCRQSGNFTIHGSMVWPLDFWEIHQENMYKIFIPYECINKIYNYLEILDITKQSIYVVDDEKDDISRNINEKNITDFYRHIDLLKEKYLNNIE